MISSTDGPVEFEVSIGGWSVNKRTCLNTLELSKLRSFCQVHSITTKSSQKDTRFYAIDDNFFLLPDSGLNYVAQNRFEEVLQCTLTSNDFTVH